MSATPNPIERCYRELVAKGKPVVRLFDGNPTAHGFHFPPEILTPCYQHYFESVRYQPDPKGDLSARKAISRYYDEQHFSISPDHLILTPGTSESFFYLFSLLTQPGDNVLMPNPSYPLLEHIAGLTHTEIRQYSLEEKKRWHIDLSDMVSKIDGRTKAIVLVSPNNPTGAVASAEELAEIATIARKNSLAVICDEVFSEFMLEEKPYPRFSNHALPPLLFVLNGISKMFALPSLKLGWIGVAGDDPGVAAAVDRLETIADTFLSTHTPIQQALPVLFEQGKGFLVHYKKEVRERAQVAMQVLSRSRKIECVPPRGGFYLTARMLTEGAVSEEDWVIDLMQQAGVFVHPGYFYDIEQGIHFIISFLAKPDTLRTSLEKVVQWIEKT